MKYIRTKDGKIIEIIKKVNIIYVSKRNEYFFENDDVKQADTIEELCDEFVVVYKKDNSHRFIQIKESLEISKKVLDEYDTYGAIWTDKGLIYVAKLNEKGEWELI